MNNAAEPAAPVTGRVRRRPFGALALSAAFVVAAVSLGVVAFRGPAAPRTLSERVHAVASTLRCPVCQDLSVADSPSRLAEEFRQRIAQQLQAGETPDQIRRGFVSAYGQWILLSPPRRGINLVAWAAPLLLLLCGLGVAAVAIRRWTSGRGMGPPGGPVLLGAPGARLSVADRRLLERALAATPEDPQ